MYVSGRKDVFPVKPDPVGGSAPNDWGLFDMDGNVYEWCSDCYDQGYYAIAKLIDPPGPVSGTTHVLRGGNWYKDAKKNAPATRIRCLPDFRRPRIGFRVAMDLK